MTTQEQKFLTDKVNEIHHLLGCRVKIKKVTSNGFSFVPDGVSVPDGFCIITNSDIKYDTLKLCQNKDNIYWIEITYAEIPHLEAQYWNGKKFVKYKK